MTSVFPRRVAQKFTLFLRARPTRRALTVFCLIWVALMLAPLLAMSFYAYPTHDDFPCVLPAAKVWAETGSLWDTLKAAWNQAMYDYQTWQGTYVAMFVCAFQPMVFSMRLFWLAPFGALTLLALSAWYLARQVTRFVLKGDLCVCAALYAALMTLLLEYVPGIRELIYWQSAIQYALSVVAVMLLCGLMIRLHAASARPAAYAWRTAAALLCAVALGGLPYPLALGGAVGMALIAAWCVWRRSPARIAAVIAFAGTALSLLAVVVAPGNAVRQERVGDSMAPLAAIVHSVVECLGCTGEWFGPQLIGLALVLGPLLWQPLKSSSMRFRNPGWVSMFSFGVLAASFVPPIYATGVDSYRLDRILGSLYMLYAVLVFLNLIYWMGWLAKRRADAAPHGVRVWQLGLCAGLLAWGLFATGAVLATPTLGAYYSLLTGEAAQYREDILAREEALLAAESLSEAQESIDFLGAQPAIFPLDMLPYQSETPLPGDMHRFFAMQHLVDQYGAGRIPAEEWEALNAWNSES